MAPETFRVLAALSSGWLGEKSLESERPFDFPAGLAKRPAGPPQVRVLFVLPDANNGRERGFYDFLFLRRLTNS